jgi:two-component system, sensor histidine kinase LadS
MKKFTVCLCFLHLSLHFFAQSPPISNTKETLLSPAPKSVFVYSDSTKYVEISPYAAVLEDAKKEFSIEQIKAMPDSCFKLHKGGRLNLGDSESRFWVRYSVENKTDGDLYWLNIFSVIHYLDLHVVSENGQLKTYPSSGSVRPFENRSLPLPNLNFNLGKRPKTVFIAIESNQGLIFYNYMGAKEAIDSFARRDERFSFFFLGLCFILIVYSLAFYFNTLDSPFLLYVFAQLGGIFYFLHFSGIGYQYVWRHYPIVSADANFHVLIPILLIGFFAMRFLNTRTIIPRFHRVLQILVFAQFCALCMQLMGYRLLSNLLTWICLLLFYINLWIAAWLVWRRNHKTARFYLAGWTVVFCATLVTSLVGAGYFPQIESTVMDNYWIQIGTMIEAIFFVFALADRMRETRHQARDAHELAIKRAYENEALIAKQTLLIEEKLKLEQQNSSTNPYETAKLLEKLRLERAKNTRLNVPTTEGVLWIPTQDIIRLEAMRSYCSIHLTNGKRIVASHPLADFEKKLDADEFMRVHKSHLVNLSQIQEYIRGEGGMLVMKDGSSVNVSRASRAAVLSRLNV